MKTDSELEPDPEPMSELQATQQWRGDANGVWVRVRGRGVAESVGALKMTGNRKYFVRIKLTLVWSLAGHKPDPVGRVEGRTGGMSLVLGIGRRTHLTLFFATDMDTNTNRGLEQRPKL